MADWTSATLGHVCADGLIQTGPFGSQLHAEDYVDDGVPVVMPANISSGRVEESGIARITEADAVRLMRHRLQVGDIVYSRRGDITRCARITEREAGWLCGTGCLLVRPGSGADHRWLAYWLSAPWTHDWLYRHAVGATMLNLNTSILASLPVELPPMEEQRRTACALGAFDDLIEHNNLTINVIRELSQRLYQRGRRNASGRVCLGEVARVSTRKANPRSGVIRYVDIASMRDGSLELPEPIKWAVAPSRARMRATSGSTLWSTVRPNRRAHALLVEAPEDLVISTGIAVLEPNGIGPAELFAATDTDEFVEQLTAKADGSAYPAVRPKDFATLRIDQLEPRHSEAFEAVMWPLLQEAHLAAVENVTLRRARDTFLPLLMSGQVRVSEDFEVL